MLKKSSIPFHDQTVVITGATSGIGYQAANDFSRLGANVIGIGRSADRCREAKERIRSAFPTARIEYLVADLTLQSEVRSAAVQIRSVLQSWHRSQLSILINNAGTYSGKRIITRDKAERTMAVNHYAPFLLTHELMPLLSQTPGSKILTVSSGSHYRTWINVDRLDQPLFYLGLWAYKVSKLANVLFTLEFNRRFNGSSVLAIAIDPGLVNTDIAFKGTDPLTALVWTLRRRSGTSPQVPVKTMLDVARLSPAQLGSNYYWKNSQPKIPSHTAQNAELARKLWEKSCAMCAIPDWLQEVEK